MQNRGSHYRTQSASSHRREDMTGPMESRYAARNGEDRRGIPSTRSDRDVTGEIPGMGRTVGKVIPDRSDPTQNVPYQVERQANPNVTTYPPRKRQRSDSSYSEREDAEIEIQELR
eukprot:1133654-Amphidinium_carterae.1